MVAKEGSLLLFPFHIVFIVLSFCLPLLVHPQCSRNPVIFNFGDSNSDTGGFAAAFGHDFGPPNGRRYLQQPSVRLCDGRLIIDFLCESLQTDHLTPYMDSLGPSFKNGANFAISGSSTIPGLIPFNLDVQVHQFTHFRARLLEPLSKCPFSGYKVLVNADDFNNALYMIDMGQNDIAGSFIFFSYAQVLQKIPSFIEEIRNAMTSIYQNGGKNFWVHNTGPLGCLPNQLAARGTNTSDFDQHGCLQSLNRAAQAFNKQLQALCEGLRSEMENAVIVYVDIYAIKYDLIANSVDYGFEDPFIACCGYGGPPYNYHPNVTCGQTGFNICNEELKYISWDGVHYTEAANAIVAFKILSANFSTPQVGFNYFCNA